MKSRHNLTSELVSREINSGHFNYMGLLPNPDKVLRKASNSMDSYRELKNDPHVWSCIQSRKSGILSLEWQLSEDGATGKDLIYDILSELDVYSMMRDILEAPLFGYQPLEVIWGICKISNKSLLTPKQIIAKPQEWFYFNNIGRLCYRKGNTMSGDLVPEFKILCPRYEPDYINPYGQSLLSKCYWPVTFKNGGLRYWVNFTEKYGMPILTAKYNRGTNKQEAEELANALNDMAEDSVIVTSADIDITLNEPQRSSSSELFAELIKYCNAEISKAILSQTLTTEIDMGSFAAAKTHFQVRQEVILSDLKLVERTINELIQWICKLNFSTSRHPLFTIQLPKSTNDTMQDQ